MKKKELLHKGKAKSIWSTDDSNIYIQEFRNSASAFNGKKTGEIPYKGELNKKICTIIFKYLEKNGIKTHFVESLNPTEMAVKKVKIIPIEFVMRNIAAGSIVKKYARKKKEKFNTPIFEIYLKADELDDPMMNFDHALAFGFLNQKDLDYIKKDFYKINDLIVNFFKDINIDLVDFKVEYGKTDSGEILLADEIAPDGCRLWDCETGKVLDKDNFRFDLGDLIEAYREIEKRLDEKGYKE